MKAYLVIAMSGVTDVVFSEMQMVGIGNSPRAVAAKDTALRLTEAFGTRLYALSCLDERTVHNQHIREMLEENIRAWQDARPERCRKEGVESD